MGGWLCRRSVASSLNLQISQPSDTKTLHYFTVVLCISNEPASKFMVLAEEVLIFYQPSFHSGQLIKGKLLLTHEGISSFIKKSTPSGRHPLAPFSTLASGPLASDGMIRQSYYGRGLYDERQYFKVDFMYQITFDGRIHSQNEGRWSKCLEHKSIFEERRRPLIVTLNLREINIIGSWKTQSPERKKVSPHIATNILSASTWNRNSLGRHSLSFVWIWNTPANACDRG